MDLKYTDDYRQSQCFIEQLNNEVIEHCKCRGEFMKGTYDTLTLIGFDPNVQYRQTNLAVPLGGHRFEITNLYFVGQVM